MILSVWDGQGWQSIYIESRNRACRRTDQWMLRGEVTSQVPRPNELGNLTRKVANGQGKTSEKAATGSAPVFSIVVFLSMHCVLSSWTCGLTPTFSDNIQKVVHRGYCRAIVGGCVCGCRWQLNCDQSYIESAQYDTHPSTHRVSNKTANLDKLLYMQICMLHKICQI